MIKFEQIRQACIIEYSNFLVGIGEYGGEYAGTPRQYAEEIFSEVECLDGLLNTLDGLGINGRNGIQFIFDSILEDK